ncbi:23S rRNA (guanosine(2251)-2'-O)-methyltransferase RlmB [Pseudomonadota bacterium]
MAKRRKHGRKDHQTTEAPTATSGRELAPASRKQGGRAPHNWLYGIHACIAAIANPERQIRRVVGATQSADDLEVPIIEAANAAAEVSEHPAPQIEWRDRRELDALLPRDAVHQGICVEAAPLPYPVIEDITEAAQGMSSACVVVLDQATDPRNIGSVMRTAAALGALAVIVQDKHAPDITGAMAKAASGAVERLPLVRVTNLARTLDQLKAAEFWCVGFDGHATDYLSPKTLQGRNAIVLGAEGAGLRRLTRETCDLLVKIPMSDAVESLNLSNAAAIALYQFAQSNS